MPDDEQSNFPYDRTLDEKAERERKERAARYERLAFMRRELREAAGIRPGESRRAAGGPPCTESLRLRVDLGERGRIEAAASALKLPVETLLRAAALSIAKKVERA